MNHENRVLSRTGARQLTQQEIGIVFGSGGIHTATLCSFNPATKMVDGDPGEC